MVIVANALYYNPVLALGALGSMGAVGPFFGAWFTAIFDNKKSGKPKHFRRMHDKKVRHVYGWCARHVELPSRSACGLASSAGVHSSSGEPGA